RGREGSVENMAFSQLTPPVGIRPTRDGGRPSRAAEAFPDLKRLNPTATVAFRHCCVGDFSTTVRGGDFLPSRPFPPRKPSSESLLYSAAALGGTSGESRGDDGN